MRLDTLKSEPFASAAEHMASEFRWLDGRLTQHLQMLREQGRFDESALRGLRLDEHHVLAGLSPSRHRTEPASDQLREIIDQRARSGEPPPLYRIADQFELNAFERTSLLITAAPSLDSRYRTALALAQNDATRQSACADLLIDILCPIQRFAQLTSFTPDAPLMRYRLLSYMRSTDDKPLADRQLVVDDRVTMALLGYTAGRTRELDQAIDMLDPQAEDWAPSLLDTKLSQKHIVVFDAARDSGQRALAARRARREGKNLLNLDMARVSNTNAESVLDLVTLAVREAHLTNALLYIEAAELKKDSVATSALISLAVANEPFVLSTSAEVAYLIAQVNPGQVQRIELTPLDAIDRLAWWQQAATDPEDPGIARLAWRSRLGPAGIGQMRGQSIDHGEIAEGRPLPALLRPVHNRWTREDLVISDTLSRQVDELTAFVSNWPKVLGDWGFAASNPQSRHCLALFCGPSGTGKTMAASIVARAAEVPLYRASLASIFDKYLGETEKQIDRLFTAAANAGIAILCDEADALFGSRTEVNDAHARYANLTVSHLLQRIEEHEGLVILTSNLPRNMDEAFARRIGHVLPFTLPDVAGRLKLWQRAIPECADVADDIDLRAIAETFELSGGGIRNAALAAAYLAAAENQSIGLRHLLRAIERELAKVGRTPIADDFGRLDAAR